MDYYDPKRTLPLIIDEWGCWHQGGTGPSKGYNLFEQQSTMRDALVAGLTLNIFNNSCDVVAMANAAQLCNNLHSLYLAGKDNFVETPNYFAFDMYKTHQNAKQINIIDDFEMIRVRDRADIKSISASASVNDNGDITITLVNMDYHQNKAIKLTSFGGKISGKADITVLTADDPRSHNSFENPKAVQPMSYNKIINENDIITLPKSSIVSIVITKGT